MALLTRLRTFLDGSDPGTDQPQVVATAALLVLVARSDGRVKDVEVAQVRAMLRSRFDLSEGAAAAVLAEAEAEDGDADAADLIGPIVRDLDPQERRALVAMAYRIATADGTMHEFEDDLVWRIGHLLGLSDGEIEAVRTRNVVAG